MTFDRIIIIIMAVFTVIGGLDRITGNRLGLGGSFENGIKTMGELALSMIGIIVLSPVIANILQPFVLPFFEFIGADPSVFAGSILACDMGGAPLARELALTDDMAKLSGIIISSMLGATVSFTVPVAMSVLSEADRHYAAKGILCGVITIPLGIVTGGLISGISIVTVLKNSVPVIVFSLIIALCLWKLERILIKAFEVFGKFIIALSTVGLVTSGIELTTGFTVIPGLGSITEAFSVVGQIAIVLSGAFPLIAVLTKLLKKPISKFGGLLKINDTSVSGLIATLANSIPIFGMVKDMDNRGKVINMAFAVSGAFVFGDHLAFTAGFEPSMITALVVSKLTAGISALALAYIITSKQDQN